MNHSLKSCLQVSKSFQWRSWSKWLRMRRQHTRRLQQNWSKFWRKMARISASLKNPLRSMMTQKVILLAMSKDLLSMLPSRRIHWSRTKVKRTSGEESTTLWMFSSQQVSFKSRASISNQIGRMPLFKEYMQRLNLEVNLLKSNATRRFLRSLFFSENF